MLLWWFNLVKFGSAERNDNGLPRDRMDREQGEQLHPSLLKGKRDYNIAIDLTLIPYHGQPYEDKKEIVRGAPKSGTTHFHGYATVSIVHDNQRFVLALCFVEYGEEMADIVRWLIKRVKALKIGIRRVFLDKGLCAKPVFKVLDQHKPSYVVPIPVSGKSGGVRTLFQGKSRKTTYHPPAIGRLGVCLVQPLHYSAPKLVFRTQATLRITQAFLVIPAPLGAHAGPCHRTSLGHQRCAPISTVCFVFVIY